ncbi:MAG: PqqD family protein, partial [Candidatus Aureabacteria bacterium]|nr:PqqD family protein [Candidatus Auribacterota bacterium]
MKPSAIYRRNPDVVFRLIAGETILVPASKETQAVGRLFTLNETGAFVWGKIDGRRSVEEIARLLAQEYGAEDKTARRDVVALLKKLEV